MASELVTYQLDGRIALIGLNRPEKRNAINDELATQLRALAERAGDEADAGVLFGHGSNFSAGLDLAELAGKLRQAAPPKKRPARHIWHSSFDAIARGKIPFVAAVHGATIGGGLELAAAAHIRVADSSAMLGLPEGQRGIFVGGGGSVRIQRIIGNATMTDMMLTGRMLDAEEGRVIRFLQYVVPAGGAFEKAKAIARRIAENTPNTNWMITNVLPRINDLSHDDGLFMEYLNSSMTRPPETIERLNDFIEKRSAPLKQRDIDD
ncbi:crotonase/enoyl-CoA hydratase family protein [Tardiphaga sp.]|jgi:enoyl-CoA hydratase/carnithine racemase|uniref:crotonase/enoyl-CoA hydratase family protein n=1 Tax=Tardiphaga sp. TaxID=1926292 RepID=UPI0037DA1A3E